MYKKLSQARCYGCDRTFDDEAARDKHASKCCPELLEAARRADADEDGDDARAAAAAAAHDASPLCYVCGRTCPTTHGFGFHVAK